MTLLDANCLIALLRGEPGADDVEMLLTTASCAISVLNRAEVIDKLARRGASADDVRADLDILGMSNLDVTGDIADLAARLRSEQYDRSTAPLSLADCVALATALITGQPLATSDDHLARAAQRNGLAVIAVQNSAGRRPG